MAMLPRVIVPSLCWVGRLVWCFCYEKVGYLNVTKMVLWIRNVSVSKYVFVFFFVGKQLTKLLVLVDQQVT